MPLIQYNARIQFDFGAVELLGEEAALLGMSRPLVVTDPGVAAAGLLDRALSALPSAVDVYADTPGNPTEDAVDDALARYLAGRCDGVVALGGGSATDTAKAVALLATHEGELAHFTLDGARSIGPVAALLAVPTAAGTGAEVGRAASLTLRDGTKAACVSQHLVPRTVICDPELTLTLPPLMTAATGMDALSHGIEATLSTRVNPPARAIALDCVRRCGRWLERAVADGEDREARWQMQMAALEGGLALQKGLGSVHALSHPLGALGAHHGMLNAVLMPAVMRFNAEHAQQGLADIREALALGPDADLADWLTDLTARLALPTSLAALGIARDELDAAAAIAEHEHLNETNPRRAVAADLRLILEDAY